MDPQTLTRREWLATGGALAAAGLTAGCSGGGSDATATETATATGTDGATETSAEAGSYTASMAPVGEVTFDETPEDIMVYSLLKADMAVAYGHGDGVNSLGFDADAGGRTLDAYYERLEGVSFDREGLTQLNTGSGSIDVDPETLFELDSDLHLMDPCLMVSFDGWSHADVEDVRERAGPWFGNYFSRAHRSPPEGCQDRYEYYTLWEIAERVAAVFRAEERYAELKAVRDEMLSTIEDRLPPEEERPTVASVIFMDGTFYPTAINTPGFANAHTRPLGASEAFESPPNNAAYGYEELLQVDPDVILHEYGIASYYDVAAKRETIASHDVGGRLSAIENERFYPSANPVQGPLMNLFQLEMTAKQLYPDEFGAWPEYETDAPYPEIPAAEQLFDRERVANAVTAD